jgi:serine/threonine-protein kinase
MALKGRVWRAGKFFVLLAALAATYVVFFAITIRIVLKSRDVRVPVLTGLTVNQARELLAEQDLGLRIEEARRLDPKVPAGRVLSQEPRAGLTTRRQRSVKVWLSDGASSTVVPALEGEQERTAQLRAQMASLALSDVATIRSSDFPAGVVVSQTPPADTKSTTMALLVNRGGEGASYVMPDLIGVPGDRAATFLRDRGFRVTVVDEQPYPGVPPGIVIRQRPQGGFQVAPGDSISLEVSR